MGETITLGAAPAADTGKMVLNIGGQDVAMDGFFKAIQMVGDAERLMLQNPQATKPLAMIGEARKIIVGAQQQIMAHPQLRQTLGPLVTHAAGPMLEAAKAAVRLRMESANRLMQHPTQTIPLTFSSAPGGTATVSVQNPYQGSGGMVFNTNSLWAITGMESGPLAQIYPSAGNSLIITSAIFAGHDYVQASLNGIVTGSVSGTGGGTILHTAALGGGWGWFIFASDKRDRPHTTFSPWNLQGASGIIGAVMRETGTATFTFSNPATSGGTVSTPFHVHVKASLCGSPFKSDDLQKMFVPWNQQVQRAHTLSQALPSAMSQMFGPALQQSTTQIRGMEDHGFLGNEYLFDMPE